MKKQGVQINLVVDKKVKEESVKVLEDLGLSLSMAINIYLKQIIKTNSIPFEIKGIKKEK